MYVIKKPKCKFSLRQDLKFVVRPNIDKKLHIITCVVNSVLLKCRKLRREDQETSDWIVSRISLF